MRMLRRGLGRVRALLLRRHADFDSELESHLDLHIADNIRGGMTPEQARRHASIALAAWSRHGSDTETRAG